MAEPEIIGQLENAQMITKAIRNAATVRGFQHILAKVARILKKKQQSDRGAHRAQEKNTRRQMKYVMTERSMHGMLMHQRKFCVASVLADMRTDNNRVSNRTASTVSP